MTWWDCRIEGARSSYEPKCLAMIYPNFLSLMEISKMAFSLDFFLTRYLI